MIRCVFPRGSRAANCLTAVNRDYVTTNSGSGHNRFSNATLSASEQVAFADGGGGRRTNDQPDRTKGARSDETRSKPYKPRELPLSPFMDPEAIAAKEKHHLPKLPPSKNPTLFQQQLAKNPYAQALATPIRLCQLTKFPMPNYFLQDFQVLAHPDTMVPWWLPMSLRKGHGDIEAKGDKAESQTKPSVATDQETGALSQAENCDFELGSPCPNKSPSSRPTPQTPRIGPGTYILARQGLISNMQNIRSGWGLQPYQNFISGSIKSPSVAKKVRDRAFWRVDMGAFMLELMRRRLVEGMVYLVQRKRGYVSGCVDWEGGKMAKRQQAAILWTGKVRIGDTAQQLNSEGDVEDGLEIFGMGSEEQQEHDGPPSFATLRVGKEKPHMVPVHNLLVLLGSDHLTVLRKKCSIFEKEVLVVKNKNITLDIQMKLWKLQGFLAFPEQKYEKGFHEKWNRAKRGLKAIPEEQQESKTQLCHGDDAEDNQPHRRGIFAKQESDPVDHDEDIQGETQRWRPTMGGESENRSHRKNRS